VEGELRISRAGESVVVPAGRKHGFRNVGSETLHVLATLAAPIFEATFDDQKELSRRWVPAAISQAE
jgi:quercetin dioxygenase-like cupin family protein